MNLQSVSCGNCGASLNLPAGVGFVTCRHCGSALKVQHTESVAFTEVLETLKEQSSRIAQNTEALQIQNEIALLDLDLPPLFRHDFADSDSEWHRSDRKMGCKKMGLYS